VRFSPSFAGSTRDLTRSRRQSTSKDLFGAGRFEARIDLPSSQGMWPAFWLNANGVQWPLGGEIDIMENRGSQPFLTSCQSAGKTSQ